MDVSTFFTRLLHPSKEQIPVRAPDDLADFDTAWKKIQETLRHPDERQVLGGITVTDVPAHLRHIVDALVYEGNRTEEDETGGCMEYFLKNDLLAHLEYLSEPDRPYGIKAELVRALNNLIVLLSERFLVHNAVHRPLRRLLKSCIGDEPEETANGRRVAGAAGSEVDTARLARDEELEGDLVDLMCILCSRMRAYPPLLLIFFHDKGWLHSHPSSGAKIDPGSRALSPTPSVKTSISDPSTRASGQATQHFEFLLFSYLLRFVHREGRTGDFSRAGLLFLFDVAFLATSAEGGENLSMTDASGKDPFQEARDALGEYILDGDFAEVMAAGLGAIYSLLPSKLHVPNLATRGDTEEGMKASVSGGMRLGGGVSDTGDPNDEELPDAPVSTNPDVRTQLDLLLKLFGFLQDIIHRCNSPVTHPDIDSSTLSTTHVLGGAVADATLAAVESSFLDNVLYPSLLECSTSDGSAVAVLTYLNVIFSNLDDGPLVDKMIEYVLDTERVCGARLAPEGQRGKRRTGDAGGVEGGMDYFADEDRFKLKDLIVDSIRSASKGASAAGFRLLRCLLDEHCQHAVKGLLRPIRESAEKPARPTGLAHEPPADRDVAVEGNYLREAFNAKDCRPNEIELYGSLINRIDPSQTSTALSGEYPAYLADSLTALQTDRCYQSNLIPLLFTGHDEKDEVIRTGTYGTDPFQHRLNPNDILLGAIMESLSQFFRHTPDQNVALTGVITSLAFCPNRSLAGWLLTDGPFDTKASDPRPPTSTVSEGASPEGPRADNRQSIATDPFIANFDVAVPAIYQTMCDLVQQVTRFRSDVDEFDRLLSERRQGLLFGDHLDEAMSVMLDAGPSELDTHSTPRPPSSLQHKRSRGALGGLISFLTPGKKDSANATPDRSAQATPDIREAAKDVSSSPFMTHYEQTASVVLDAQSSALVSSGPWSSDRSTRFTRQISAPSASSKSHDPFDLQPSSSPGRLPAVVDRADPVPQRVNLSSVLDNCVILEEVLKEIVGVITARRSLGVDQVGFM